MAEEQLHYTEFQAMRQDLVDWGYANLDDWFANEQENCELLLEWLQGELQGRQVAAIERGFDSDEGHAERIAKLEDTIKVVQKMIAEIGGAGSLETTAVRQSREPPAEETPQDEDGEQDMVVSDGE